MAMSLSPMRSAIPRRPRHDDLDNYDAGDFDDEDIFRSPSPQPAAATKEDGAAGLGLDEEVDVGKRARVPRIKLDESKLLSPQGVTKLRKKAKELKFKGKGHEFSDTTKLLALYQLWLDDLFPKAKFLDALAMIEKVGHKNFMIKHRMDWINEGRLNKGHTAMDDDEWDLAAAGDAPDDAQGESGHPQPRTPPPGAGTLDDEDIYDATPRVSNKSGNAQSETAGAPDEEEDLDALIAEAEAIGGGTSAQQPTAKAPAENDFADEEAAMAEMEGLW